MNARNKIRVLPATVCMCLLLPHAAAQPEPVDFEFLHGMVVAAQVLSERAQELQAAGSEDLAEELFDQALNILVDADQRSAGQHRSRFGHVYNRFYETRAASDPAVAIDQVRIKSQIESAYQGDPVQPAQVDEMVRYMARHKKQFLANSFRRSLRYIPMIRTEFEAQGIPADLAYMALVESGFRPDPTSHVGAQGLWQFMPATGRQYGLRVSDGVDERNDPVKATRAAGKYLRALYQRFGNWPLAVAAYNCGEGRVERSLRKHNVNTFWDLAEVGGLPRETQQYVPSIVAATIISRDPAKYGIAYP